MSDSLMSNVPASSLTCLPLVFHILTVQSGLACSNPVFEYDWKKLLSLFYFHLLTWEDVSHM